MNNEEIQNYLWTEKYRPKSIDDYVWLNDDLKFQFLKWVKEKEIPHLLLAGSPGTGKTSLAFLLFQKLNVHKSDILLLNASSSRGIDTIRDVITNFASTLPVGNLKFILLDEADSLTNAAQLSLRNVMETYSNTCRFILTCNYVNKIINPIKSRCSVFIFKTLDKDFCLKRVAEILMNEGADLNENILLNANEYVNFYWPDLRKIINSIQQNWNGNEIKKLNSLEKNDYIEDFYNIFNKFKNKDINSGRNLIANILSENDYVVYYRFLYDNLENLGFKTYEKQSMAIIIIAEGLKNNSVVADQEINLTSTILQLMNYID